MCSSSLPDTHAHKPVAKKAAKECSFELPDVAWHVIQFHNGKCANGGNLIHPSSIAFIQTSLTTSAWKHRVRKLTVRPVFITVIAFADAIEAAESAPELKMIYARAIDPIKFPCTVQEWQ